MTQTYTPAIAATAVNILQHENEELESLFISQNQLHNNALFQYKQLFNESSAGMLLVEIPEFPFTIDQVQIVDVNSAFTHLTQSNWNVAIGCGLSQVFDSEMWYSVFCQCFIDTCPTVISTKSNRYVRVAVSRMSRMLYVFTLQDVTEYINKQIQLESELSKAKQDDALKLAFLSNMSHEIRTPLNGIVGFVDLLIAQQHISEEKRNSFLEMIRFSSEQLVRVVNDILDISKIESNRLEMMPTRCNINTLIDNLQLFAEVEQQRLRRYNIRITNRKSLKDKQAIILIDGIRLRQVLFNLLTNAIKFSFVGFVQFGYKFDAEKMELMFFVKDSGIGIREDEQVCLFERFKQLKNNLELSQSGTGLGLAICKHLVELMGGQISLESKEDEGSLFWFTIPYRAVSDSAN